jgi:transposase
MSQQINARIVVVGIDIGKNSFHIVGQDTHGEIVLRQKWSRHQVEARFANMPACLSGSRRLISDRSLVACVLALDGKLNSEQRADSGINRSNV